MNTTISIPDDLRQVLTSFPKAYLVGGCVRDHLLGLSPKDFDIEVYDISYDDLTNKLRAFGKVDTVGKSFAVIKLTLPSGEIHDFSLPRRDNKIEDQSGHKAFKIETDIKITEKEGASRRDLTINAMAWNPKTGEILDFYSGLEDLNNKILRHTSEQFGEDPLRPLRLFQFSARFGFDVAPETQELCKSISHTYYSLDSERIGEEFNKFLLKGKDHVKGFETLSKIGWLKHFQDLAALEFLEQDIEFHPEGTVLTHTGHCLTAMSQLKEWKALSPRDQLTAMYGILCHDLGKRTTTKVEFKPKLGRNAIVSPGHDKAGVEPSKTLLAQLHAPHDCIKKVLPLVAHHMDHLQVRTDTHIRRLAVQMQPSSIEQLGLIVEADHSGRPPKDKEQPAEMLHILKQAEALGCLVSPQAPILKGGDIVAMGIKPGKAIGVLFDAAYEAQINGHIKSKADADTWFKNNRAKILEANKLAPARLISGDYLRELGWKPGEGFGKAHRDVYEAQFDKKVQTLPEALEWLIAHESEYAIPTEVVTTLRGLLPVEPEIV